MNNKFFYLQQKNKLFNEVVSNSNYEDRILLIII